MTDTLAEAFEAERPRLRALAHRLLGSFSEADDAVQDAWLRLSRTAPGEVENLAGWLTTVTARICLDQLRARRSRREDPVGFDLPEPVVTPPLVAPAGGGDPEEEALLAEAVGLALAAVLAALGPAERLAFVLHDLFAVPFDEIARILGRSPAAATQLASRARRRLRGAQSPAAGVDAAEQRRLVAAFQAAARDGDLERLLGVLDPDVVLRVDTGPSAARELRGARAVAGRASEFAPMAPHGRAALVNGRPGLAVVSPELGVVAVLGFRVRAGRITEIDVVAEPGRLRHVDPALFVD